MERAALQEILDRADGVTRAKPDGSYTVGPNVDATLFAEGGIEMLVLSRVERLDLAERHVAATLAKGERYFLAYARLVAIKTEAREERKGERGAGFR